MKINRIISIILVIIMLNINTLAWGSFLSDSKQEDCLAPGLKIQDQAIYSQFQGMINGQDSIGIDPQTIKNSQELMRSYQDNISAAQLRIILPAIDELDLKNNRTEVPEILERWFDDKSDSVSKRRDLVLRYLNYELLGKQAVNDLNSITSLDFIQSEHKDLVFRALSACGTRAFFNYYVLYNLGDFKQGDIVTIESDKDGVNHIFTGIKTEKQGKVYFKIIDSLDGKKITAADMGLTAEGISELEQQVLIDKGYRIHEGKEAVRFSLAYILNNIGVMNYAVFLDSKNLLFLEKSEKYLKQASRIAPEYAISKKNLLQVLQKKHSLVDDSRKPQADNIQAQLEALNPAQRYFADKIIAKGGRINFAEFMQDALYSEHGFFTNSVSVGRDKSFDTYAESLPFAHCLAAQLVEMWEKMGSPKKFSIVEMGAGSGTLVKNIVAYLKLNNQGLYKALDYVIVEISPKLKEDQQIAVLNEFGALEGIPIRWIKGTAFDLSEIKDIEGVFLSNEMPDNFPVHRIRKENGQVYEVYVAFENGRFIDQLGPISNSQLQDYVDSLGIELEDGQEIPVNLKLSVWQQQVSTALKKGFVITIDYGGKHDEIVSQPFAVWNRETFLIEDDADKMEYIYNNCGKCDITAEVNFYDLANWGIQNGLNVQGYTFQRDFFWNLGFDDVLDDLVYNGVKVPRHKSVSHDMATNFHFKVLVQSKNLDEDIDLAGFDGMDNLYFLYNREVRVKLSIGPDQSSFLVYTKEISFDPESIKQGKQAVKDSTNRGYSYGGNGSATRIIEARKYNLEDGKYVLGFSREELQEAKIYDDKANLIFDGWKNFESQKEDKFALELDTFEQKFMSTFDLSKRQTEIIPDILYLHQDGSLQTFSPEFLPSGVIDKKSSSENSLKLQIERAI